MDSTDTLRLVDYVVLQCPFSGLWTLSTRPRGETGYYETVGVYRTARAARDAVSAPLVYSWRRRNQRGGAVYYATGEE